MSSIRILKLNRLFTQKIQELIHQEFAEDYGLITVNMVDTSADLAIAIIYIRCYPEDKQEKIVRNLNKKTKYYRKYLGHLLSIRKIPQLEFKIDKGLEKVNKIELLLSKIHQEKDLK